MPHYVQQEHHCGPAALRMAAAWAGAPITERRAAETVFTEGKAGSITTDLITAARRHGLLAYPLAPELRAVLTEAAAGHPVVILQNRGLSLLPLWHYALVIGYDLDEQTVELRSGTEESLQLSLSTFERTWARGGRWAAVFLKPPALPATVDEGRYLRAAVGLERAGQNRPAATAYRAFLSVDPKNVLAAVGLSNSLLQVDDVEGAEQALRRALALNPDEPVLLNNMAHLFMMQGRLDEAHEAATAATARGGSHTQVYRRTLEEIAARRRTAAGATSEIPAAARGAAPHAPHAGD